MKALISYPGEDGSNKGSGDEDSDGALSSDKGGGEGDETEDLSPDTSSPEGKGKKKKKNAGDSKL